MLADRFHWTPQEVDRMDPDFLDELDAYMKAEADHERAANRAAERAMSRRRGGDG